MKFLRHYTDGLLTTSKEDGPYPDWQLRVKQTSTPDDVTWQDKGESALVGTNDLRYGRMVLQDVAGDINGDKDQTLTIPLRVEYWDGSAFITNADDSISRFNGINYCRQILFPAKANNVPYTKGLGNVTLGDAILSHLVAAHDGKNKEKQQVRFWQRIGESTPVNIGDCKGGYINQPWLRYNWRGLGDEDPSATVTFGVYHGNNRIIYRGETNDVGHSIPYQNYQ